MSKQPAVGSQCSRHMFQDIEYTATYVEKIMRLCYRVARWPCPAGASAAARGLGRAASGAGSRQLQGCSAGGCSCLNMRARVQAVGSLVGGSRRCQVPAALPAAVLTPEHACTGPSTGCREPVKSVVGAGPWQVQGCFAGMMFLGHGVCGLKDNLQGIERLLWHRVGAAVNAALDQSRLRMRGQACAVTCG